MPGRPLRIHRGVSLRVVSVQHSEHTPASVAADRSIVPSSSLCMVHVVVDERWHFVIANVTTAGEDESRIWVSDEHGLLPDRQPIAKSKRIGGAGLVDALRFVSEKAEEVHGQWQQRVQTRPEPDA